MAVDEAAPVPATTPLDEAAAAPPRLTRTRLISLVALIVIAGCAVYLLARPEADTPTSAIKAPAQHEASASVSGSSAITAAAPTRPLDSRTVHPKDKPFIASGVRFTVFPNPTAPWANRIAATEPGAGRRWQLVSVLYRNLTRQRLFTEDLHFRLKSADNVIYKPAGVGNGGSNLAPATPIFRDTLVKGQLAFLVPAEAGALWLMIDPGPRTRVRVGLGPG